MLPRDYASHLRVPMFYNDNTVYENGHVFTREELAALIAQDIVDFFNHCV